VRPRRALLALAPLLVLAAEASAAALFAGRVTAANAARRLVGGPDAVGGIGDFALANGTLCALISDPAHAPSISDRGGFLTDLGHCGRDDDFLADLVWLVNASRKNVARVESVEARFDHREARVTTIARWKGIELRSAYVLDAATPDALRVETRVERVAPGGRFVLLGLLAVHPSASLRTFTLDSEFSELGHGFAHPPAPDEGIASVLAGLSRADGQILVADDGYGPGIAYGLQLASAWLEDGEGERAMLPSVGLNGAAFTVLGVFARPFWLGGGPRLGLLQLAQAPLMNLPRGTRLHLVHRIQVGERGDVASVTDRLWSDGPEVTGQVDDAAARLHVSRDGIPTTQVRPAADGRFAFRVPKAGRYEVRAVAPGASEVRLPIAVEAGGLALGRVALGGVARVVLPRGHAMRLVFRGLDGTPNPRFGDDLLGLRFGQDTPAGSALTSDVSLAGTPDDPAEVTLAPGRYRVLATRGIEWSVEEARIEARAGESVPLHVGIPRRQLETPGWILADLHVHAGGSFDSTLPAAERIRSFVAQGGEVLVATEHDHVVDYRPLARAMGLGDALRILPGLEVTSIMHSEATPRTAGHANALPLEPVPFAFRGGALTSQGVRLRVPIAELRARGGERIFQLNHPRRSHDAPDDESLLTHLSVAGRPFDPTRPLSAEPNRVLVERDPGTGVRDLDFDALELLNGATDTDLATYKRTRADWFSLLLQGERRTGTANSDSHKLRQLVAIPASWVRVPDDRPSRLDEVAFVRAIRDGELVGSSGPFLTVRLGEQGPGGLVAGAAGELSVRVDAADWVPVGELRVYVDGALRERRAIARGESARVPLRFAADAFVTVEVQGAATGPEGERYRAVAPRFVPFAYSNPIFVDADGDGRWTPPGLVAPLPATIRDPLGS